jgi:hypothetical protein
MRHWPILPGPAAVAVPKTAVNQHDPAPGRKHQIRNSGQIPQMQSESKTHAMDKTPDRDFRLRVLAPDASHESASFNFRQDVHRRFA